MSNAKQARITTIQWQWANSSVGAAGVAMASIVLSRSVVLHAIVPSSDLRDLSCAEASNPKHWVAAHANSIPGGYGEPMAYSQRYGVIHPDQARVRNSQSVRLTCEFPTAPRTGGQLTLRHRRWRISRIPIRTAAVEHPSRAGATVTICIPYTYGVGSGSLTTRRLVEFVAWYELLGASQVVLFDDVEPELERQAGARSQAARQRRAINAMAAAFPRRFAVVRGLCWHDTMLQASPHANCQALAANMCLDLARATNTTSHNFVSSLDLDEFLVPPIAAEGRDAVGAEEGAHLALMRLATRIKEGERGEQQSVLQRNSNGVGSCTKFADVYYLPPECNRGMAQPSSDPARLDLVDFASRGTPDNFESGPSTSWRQREWGPFVRAKFLVDTFNARQRRHWHPPVLRAKR